MLKDTSFGLFVSDLTRGGEARAAQYRGMVRSDIKPQIILKP